MVNLLDLSISLVDRFRVDKHEVHTCSVCTRDIRDNKNKYQHLYKEVYKRNISDGECRHLYTLYV